MWARICLLILPKSFGLKEGGNKGKTKEKIKKEVKKLIELCVASITVFVTCCLVS